MASPDSVVTEYHDSSDVSDCGFKGCSFRGGRGDGCADYERGHGVEENCDE